jgi:putative flippase GtrA
LTGTLELQATDSSQTEQEEGIRSSTPQLTQPSKRRSGLLWQFVRFCLVGGLNTTVDLLVLNGLLWFWPTQNTMLLLTYNSLAYMVGAVNSFIGNKYWTFRQRRPTSAAEVTRFAVTTLLGIACNDVLLWIVGRLLHPAILSATLWTNVSKLLAVGGTVLISYVGMRLWVFVHRPQEKQIMPAFQSNTSPTLNEGRGLPYIHESLQAYRPGSRATITPHSLSVVLPAYNEEHVIATTLADVLSVLHRQVRDFEVIVVNDGSTDRTGAIVEAIAASDARVRLVTHATNQGYGAALADGFAVASRELTFFMDSDGQFDIRDLARLFLFIDEYDAVIGYRIDRQDSWLRKLNAWGWKLLAGFVLDVHVRDIDCAFKLLRTDFLHQYPLETRGAMLNAELLYKLKLAGCSYYEVGVRHLPRRSGRATGANLRVIIRALRELFLYERRWRQEQHIKLLQRAM